MLKRKYGDRSEWKRVLKRQYAQTYLDTKDFKGYLVRLQKFYQQGKEFAMQSQIYLQPCFVLKVYLQDFVIND